MLALSLGKPETAGSTLTAMVPQLESALGRGG